MERRKILLAGVAGAAGLLTAKYFQDGSIDRPALAAKPGGSCPPPPGEFIKTIPCLPPGLIEIETEEGEIFEAIVPANGQLRLTLRSIFALPGMWTVLEPGNTVIDCTPGGVWVDPIQDHFIAAGSVFAAAWAYRNPADVPGTILKGAIGADMVFRVDSGANTIPDLAVDLVEWDVAVTDQSDLTQFPYPPTPPVRQILASFTIPGGTGLRNIPVNPIIIPWNAKFLGIIRRTPVTVTTMLWLRSLGATGLEVVPAS